MSFSLLSPLVATELYQSSSTRVVKHRQLIPSRRDLLWRVERGVVRTTTTTEDGILIILGYWGAGDIIGHAMSQLGTYQIECLSEVEVSLLRQAQSSQALDALIGHIQQIQELLMIVHQHPLQQKLWQFLTFLALKFGVEVKQGVLIDLNLSHQAIAETINTTRTMVTQLLQTFEDESLLLRQKKQLIILHQSSANK